MYKSSFVYIGIVIDSPCCEELTGKAGKSHTVNGLIFIYEMGKWGTKEKSFARCCTEKLAEPRKDYRSVKWSPVLSVQNNYSLLRVHKLIIFDILVLQNCFNFKQKFSSHYYTNEFSQKMDWLWTSSLAN